MWGRYFLLTTISLFNLAILLISLFTFLCFHFQEISPYQLGIGFWTPSLVNVWKGPDPQCHPPLLPTSSLPVNIIFKLAPYLMFKRIRPHGTWTQIYLEGRWEPHCHAQLECTQCETAERARLDSNESIFEALWWALWWLPVDSLLTLSQVF